MQTRDNKIFDIKYMDMLFKSYGLLVARFDDYDNPTLDIKYEEEYILPKEMCRYFQKKGTFSHENYVQTIDKFVSRYIKDEPDNESIDRFLLRHQDKLERYHIHINRLR